MTKIAHVDSVIDLEAYHSKTFRNGQLVWVSRLGESTPGEFAAVIVGIYANDFYIVEWIDRPPGLGEWSTSVMAKGCIDQAES